MRKLRIIVAGRVLALLITLALSHASASAGEAPLRLGVTTTIENSGLLAYLLPRFTAATGVKVRAIIRGTGAVLRAGRSGDVDVILSHDPVGERAFVAGGYGLLRRDVMFNHFIIVGPAEDPARLRGLARAPLAFARIAAAGAAFVSRGDDSGTHRAERAIWAAAGVDPVKSSGRWYLEAGSGMGATLNLAAGRGAYTLADSATWRAFANKGALVSLLAGDKALVNQYGVTLVNPKRFARLNAKAARRFADWITSAEGQAGISGFRIGGRQAFTGNARR
ncbi:MAG: substrate-binding domain-containing protein [Alphaproteobacteria bacterium]